MKILIFFRTFCSASNKIEWSLNFDPRFGDWNKEMKYRRFTVLITSFPKVFEWKSNDLELQNPVRSWDLVIYHEIWDLSPRQMCTSFSNAGCFSKP